MNRALTLDDRQSQWGSSRAAPGTNAITIEATFAGLAGLTVAEPLPADEFASPSSDSGGSTDHGSRRRPRVCRRPAA